MPRIIFKCPYFKGDGNSAPHLQNLVKYMGSRDGVDKIDDSHKELPATVKQKNLIKQILKEFPSSKNLFEYADYCANPTIENASEFISQSLEQNLDQIAKRENYVEYIGQRPGVELDGTHGLFTDAGIPVVLDQAAKEAANHPGNVWTPIISLRREDAARLGYDNGEAWRSLLRSYAGDLADNMKIPREDFRWYAAFHNQSHHPHIHMVCYSTNPKKGFLTQIGIEQIKSGLAKRIFRQDLLQIYSEQTTYRDLLTSETDARMRELCEKLRTGLTESVMIEQMIMQLSKRLANTKGKKVYGYLKPDVKQLVDQIVDELSKTEPLSELYNMWWQKRLEVLNTYSDNVPVKPPLSKQKEFKRIKNIVIEQAMQINTNTFEDGQTSKFPELDEPAPDFNFVAGDEPDALAEIDDRKKSEITEDIRDDSVYCLKWSTPYKTAKASLLADTPDFDTALKLFESEAGQGNVLAMFELGKMYANGLGVDCNQIHSQDWYKKTLGGFLQLAESFKGSNKNSYLQYRIGKMYAAGLGCKQDNTKAAQWFQSSANNGNKYAQYSLAGLYANGNGVEKDTQKAVQLYKNSANQGFPYADYVLGKWYQDGIGTSVNKEKSSEYFKKAFAGFLSMELDSCDDMLQYRIGHMLLTGEGVERDIPKAKEYLKKAAKKNNCHALYQLANLVLEYEPDNTQDMQMVMKRLLKLAEQDLDYAQYALGKLYLKQKNINQSVHWLTKSAGHNNPSAQYTLGKIFLTGAETKKDVNLAIQYFLSSAQQGNQFAQYQLGKLYLIGKDVQRDKELAITWLTHSAKQGNVYAQFFLDHLDDFHDPSLLLCTSQLLRSIATIIKDDALPKLNYGINQIDRKRRRQLHQKKIALGHANDEKLDLNYESKYR